MYIEKLKLDAIGQLSRSIRDAFVADTCFYVSKYMHNNVVFNLSTLFVLSKNILN